MSVITQLQGSTPVTTAGAAAIINNNCNALNTDKIETSTLDTDTTLAANSDAKIPTQKAVKAYVDAGGNVNASEVQKGIVEEATDAEVTAGTATGATGAKLFVTPTKLATRLPVYVGGYVTAIATPVVRVYLTADSPATWTKPAGLKYVVVEIQAAGGNGGADNDGGGGGGGGAYNKKLIVTSALGSTETVTIGAGGVGSGNTSFGALLVAPNGTNGVANIAGVGGASSGGDLNISGQNGRNGVDEGTQIFGGAGGSSFLGLKADETIFSGDSSIAINGENGGGYGAGGAGASPASDGSPTGTGGTGAPGIVIVTEYYV